MPCEVKSYCRQATVVISSNTSVFSAGHAQPNELLGFFEMEVWNGPFKNFGGSTKGRNWTVAIQEERIFVFLWNGTDDLRIRALGYCSVVVAEGFVSYVDNGYKSNYGYNLG